MRLFALALVASLFAAPVAALPFSSHAFDYAPDQAGPVERVRVSGIGQFAYQRLFEAVSEPGESMDSFARRVGPALRAYSDATGFEACGVLATDGERFGVIVGSNHSHIACANFHGKVPAGMRDTGETIHSHGKTERFNANRNDTVLAGQHFHGKPGVRTVAGQQLDAFSDTDYESGAGYLATPSGVLHQRGKGTSRTLRD